MSLRQDVTYAARLLWRSPLFTLTAVLSLAIGIAGNAAIFSIADAVFLRPNPHIAAPGRLVDVVGVSRERRGNMSYLNYADYRARNSVFSGLAALQQFRTAYGLSTGETAERVYGASVAGNYFSVLGVEIIAGRGFSEADDRPGAAPVIVITDALWQRRFNRDQAIVGSTVRLNGRPVTVAGVAPAGFRGHTVTGTDFWIPIVAAAELRGNSEVLNTRAGVAFQAIGRLKPGISRSQAAAELSRIAGDLRREYPQDNAETGVAVVPARALPIEVVPAAAAFVGLLFGLVGLILLIACTNVGGMLLARTAARSREVAVRLALGASRHRVVRLLVIESGLLGTAGSVVGIALAVAVIRLLTELTPLLPFPLDTQIRLDWRVTLFATVLAVFAGIACGLLPALESSRTDLTAAIKTSSMDRGPRRLRLRQAFVVAQVAMSVLLVITALLLGRSLVNAVSVDPGFSVADVDVARIDLALAGYQEADGRAFTDALIARVSALPNVVSSTTSMVVPLTVNAMGFGPLRLPGQAFDQRSAIFPDWNVVGSGYFETLQIPLVAGRDFSPADRPGTAEVVILNQTLTRRLFGRANPIGQTVLHRSGGPVNPSDRTLLVIGVARDAKYGWIGEDPQPFAYLPAAQNYRGDASLLVRTAGPSVLPSIRTLVRQIDPGLPIVEAASLRDLSAFSLIPQRLAAWLAGGVGIVGLLLVAIGIYGITSFTAGQRQREIGVRVALGAVRHEIVTMIVRQSMMLTIAGAVIGVALAVGAAQLLAAFLYGLAPLDAPSFVGGVALLAALACAASLAPAWVAASDNPTDALRTE